MEHLSAILSVAETPGKAEQTVLKIIEICGEDEEVIRLQNLPTAGCVTKSVLDLRQCTLPGALLLITDHLIHIFFTGDWRGKRGTQENQRVSNKRDSFRRRRALCLADNNEVSIGYYAIGHCP